MAQGFWKKIIELAPNIANKNSGQTFIQSAPQTNYGNFAQDMAALQQEANNQAILDKAAEIQNAQQPSITNKIISGLDNLQRGYNENLNNGFHPNNFGNNQFTEVIPADTAKLQNYQQQLLSQGIDPKVVGAVAEGKNSGNKDIDNWIKANPDALNSTTVSYEKTPMGKLGEAAGSVMRFANSPIGQALIQGALVGYANQDAGKGVAAGLQAAQDRAADQTYRQALLNEGIDLGNPSLLSNISQRDYASIMGEKDKKLTREALAQYRTQQQENWQKNYERQLKADENTANYRNEKLKIERTKAARKGGGKTPKTKLEDNPNYRAALGTFVNLKGDQRRYARMKIIQDFGVDPEAKIKQVKEQESLFDDED